jgi:hypothetical protein
MEDHKKLQIVQNFLTEIYGGETSPLFEINSMTVSKLYDLALQRKKTIVEEKIALEYNEILAKEYSVQGMITFELIKRFLNLLAFQTAKKIKSYGYPIENLPPPLAQQLQSLAEIGISSFGGKSKSNNGNCTIGVQLELKDFKLSRYIFILLRRSNSLILSLVSFWL